MSVLDLWPLGRLVVADHFKAVQQVFDVGDSEVLDHHGNPR